METRVTICNVCGKPTAVCNTFNHTGGLTINRINREELGKMANREILISKERVYITQDGKKRAEAGNDEPRKLLVGKGGEIERSVAEFYGVSTEEALSVSVVTPLVEEDYNRMKRIGEQNPEQTIREEINRSIDPKSLQMGAGVSTQASMMASGAIANAKADADKTAGVDHITPQPATDAETNAEPDTGKQAIITGDTGQPILTGQASPQASSSRSKVIGEQPQTATDTQGAGEDTATDKTQTETADKAAGDTANELQAEMLKDEKAGSIPVTNTGLLNAQNTQNAPLRENENDLTSKTLKELADGENPQN